MFSALQQEILNELDAELDHSKDSQELGEADEEVHEKIDGDDLIEGGLEENGERGVEPTVHFIATHAGDTAHAPVPEHELTPAPQPQPETDPQTQPQSGTAPPRSQPETEPQSQSETAPQPQPVSKVAKPRKERVSAVKKVSQNHLKKVLIPVERTQDNFEPMFSHENVIEDTNEFFNIEWNERRTMVAYFKSWAHHSQKDICNHHTINQIVKQHPIQTSSVY